MSRLGRHDLPRLWPVISTTLYPESEKRLQYAIQEIKSSIASTQEEEGWKEMSDALELLDQLVTVHYKETAKLIAERLQAAPYGAEKFAPNHFSDACKKCELSSGKIKKQWTIVRNIARHRLSRSFSSTENKLAFARLNSLEQDILYVLFVEQQYLCPLINRKTD